MQGFISQCVLVMLLTVYIMSTFSVDNDANKDLGELQMCANWRLGVTDTSWGRRSHCIADQ
eukprot:COSAG02_NODE_6574_length_3486_cov_2.401240_5_plen_61_part_00